MATRFDTLFSITVSHAYYGGVYQDIRFVFPRDTAQRMRGGRMSTRSAGGVLDVHFEADEAAAPIVSIAGATLRIGLKPLDPCFAKFTDLDLAIPFCRNATAPNQLDPPLMVALVGRVFSHTLAQAARPVVVTLKDAGGQPLHTETVTDEQKRSTVTLDLTSVSPGMCTVEETYPDDVTRSSAYYVDPELRQQGVVSVIEIQIDSTLYTAPAAFAITFDARIETLKYYLVIKNYTNGEIDHLTVTDAGFSEEERTEVVFVKVPSSAFTEADIPADVLANGGATVVLFQSRDPVARQRRGRRNIQLKRRDEVLVEHLPQPGPDRMDANLIIHVSKS